MYCYFFNLYHFGVKIYYNEELNKINRIEFNKKYLHEKTSKKIPPLIQALMEQLMIGADGGGTNFPEDFLEISQLSKNEIKVLEILKQTLPGKTLSYSELAIKAGFSPKAARFIGNTMAKNPFPIIFPCHRVIKKDNTLGKYSGGVNIKKFLLKQENRKM